MKKKLRPFYASVSTSPNPRIVIELGQKEVQKTSSGGSAYTRRKNSTKNKKWGKKP